MNILPLILTFLLIFSILSVGFLRGQKATSLVEKCAARFYHTNRSVVNKVAEKSYNRVKIDNLPDPTKTPKLEKPSQKRSKSLVSKRENASLFEVSKLNLTPLLETKTDPKRHPLYEIAAELLRLLYRDKLLKEGQEWEYALLDSFCTLENPKTLSDLYPTTSTLQPLFYKMLKGTHHYQLKTNQGIAPLAHFFTLGKQSAIYFSFASPLLLEAIFGKKITEKILAEEKKKENNSSLNHDELTPLLTGDPACSALISELGPELNFLKKKEKRNAVSVIDPQSDLTIIKSF